MGVTTSAEDGVDIFQIGHGGIRQIFATVLPDPNEDLATILRRLRRSVSESSVEFLEVRVFGSVDSLECCTEAVHEVFGQIDFPMFLVQGQSCFGGPVAGIQLHAVAGSSVETIHCDGSPVGRVFEDDHARYCVLGNLHSPQPSGSGACQTRDTLERMIGGLSSAGMNIHDLVRTWFFIDEILEWYPTFNEVRSEIYSAEGVFGRYVPASTGIGGCNSASAALVASALGIQAKGEDITVGEIPSPLQCPALDYGSSFSRAAQVLTPDCRFIHVSGTASIDDQGATVNLGHTDGQVARTLDIVGAILKSKGMDYADVVRGNAYFKDSAEVGKLEKYGLRHGLPFSRVVISQNDVCRDDLLFELEVMAAKTDKQPLGVGKTGVSSH